MLKEIKFQSLIPLGRDSNSDFFPARITLRFATLNPRQQVVVLRKITTAKMMEPLRGYYFTCNRIG